MEPWSPVSLVLSVFLERNELISLIEGWSLFVKFPSLSSLLGVGFIARLTSHAKDCTPVPISHSNPNALFYLVGSASSTFSSDSVQLCAARSWSARWTAARAEHALIAFFCGSATRWISCRTRAPARLVCTQPFSGCLQQIGRPAAKEPRISACIIAECCFRQSEALLRQARTQAGPSSNCSSNSNQL